jgi:hypothetical protein
LASLRLFLGLVVVVVVVAVSSRIGVTLDAKILAMLLIPFGRCCCLVAFVLLLVPALPPVVAGNPAELLDEGFLDSAITLSFFFLSLHFFP